jgi:hypothetical protein
VFEILTVFMVLGTIIVLAFRFGPPQGTPRGSSQARVTPTCCETKACCEQPAAESSVTGDAELDRIVDR